MSKPVVHYGDVRFYHHTETGKRFAAVFDVLDHPSLGEQPLVYTSEILVECEDGKSFETLNTIYRKKEEDDSV